MKPTIKSREQLVSGSHEETAKIKTAKSSSDLAKAVYDIQTEMQQRWLLVDDEIAWLNETHRALANCLRVRNGEKEIRRDIIEELGRFVDRLSVLRGEK